MLSLELDDVGNKSRIDVPVKRKCDRTGSVCEAREPAGKMRDCVVGDCQKIDVFRGGHEPQHIARAQFEHRLVPGQHKLEVGCGVNDMVHESAHGLFLVGIQGCVELVKGCVFGHEVIVWPAFLRGGDWGDRMDA